MSSYRAINDYNTYLVENQLNINIIDYVKEVNKLNITKKKIDISFIDEFIELVNKEVKHKQCLCFRNKIIKTLFLLFYRMLYLS